MGQTFFLVESEEKRQTLHGIMQGDGEVLVAPAIAAVVEAQNIGNLARGEEGFLFRPASASYDVLKKILQNGQTEIYLAFDRSERGEYSSWLWAGMIGQMSKGALQCRRLHLAGLDAECVAKAMELVEPLDSVQSACFYFEECFQRCLASHLQRLLGTRSGPGNIPLSIPVLAILTLLAEREKEVREFSGKPKWHVELSLKGSKEAFPAELKEVFGVCCDGTLEGRDQAKAVAEDLVGQSFRVVARQENSLEIPAPQPYTFYELVFDAFRYGQIPVAEALQGAISLFTGVTVGGKRQALISSLYPVTLGNVQPLVEPVGRHVEACFGGEAMQRWPLLGQGIMPLYPEIGPEELSGLPENLQKIYDLVWRRAMASQMQEGIGKEIILDLESEKYRLQSGFRGIEALGFLQVYQYGFATLLSTRIEDTLHKDEVASVVQVVPEQRFGMTSDRYTLSSLVDDLEELGIQRQDEVVQNLGRLSAAGYVTLQGNGILQCQANLFKVVNTLNRAFPGMQGLNFIVYYAQTLDEVASGRKRFQMALKQFDQNLIMQGQPLVKVKLPTSLPQRLKKSKSIIKTDEVPAGDEKGAASSGLENVPFADFSQIGTGGQAQGPADPVEAAPPSAVQHAVVGTPESVRQGPSDLPEDEGLQDQIQEMEGAAGDGEQGLPDQDEETILLDEEAQEQVATAPDEEGVKLFQDADEQLPEPPADSTATRPAPAEPGSPLDKEDKEKGLDEVVTKPCPECGRAMVRKGDRLGQYWACTGVPACRHTEGAQEKEGDDALKCPLCHQGQLVVKRTPTGKDMYVCRREACEFMAWSKPHAIHCPMCSSSFLVEKKEVSGKIVLRCPKAGCNYSQPMAVGDEQEAPVMRKRVVVRRTAGSSGGSGKRKVVVRRRK